MNPTHQTLSSGAFADPAVVQVRGAGKRKTAIRQRDLTKALRAARAAGIASFELEDALSGLIFRVGPDPVASSQDELDLELSQFAARCHGQGRA